MANVNDASVPEVWPQYCECGAELADEAEVTAHACDWEEIDLSGCPYFRKYYRLPGAGEEGAYGPGTCTGGCWEEPHCVTSRPSEGWPGESALTRTSTSGTYASVTTPPRPVREIDTIPLREPFFGWGMDGPCLGGTEHKPHPDGYCNTCGTPDVTGPYVTSSSDEAGDERTG